MRINATSRYTHLGTMQNHRLALASEALKAIRVKVLRNVHISKDKRFDLARAVILSRMFDGTKEWTVINEKHLKKVDGFLYEITSSTGGRIPLRPSSFFYLSEPP